MSVFSPVSGLYPSGVGGGQTRTGSVEGGRAPFGRFGGPGVGLGRTGIWTPQGRGPMSVFSPVLGMYPPGIGGGQTRAGSTEGGCDPFGRFVGPGVGFGRSGIWTPLGR